MAPLLKGLPDDRCPCPHWGYVLKGTVTFTFADRSETFETGESFYISPGHTPVHFACSWASVWQPILMSSGV